MGPTPEPVPDGGLSDEDMPQQPPIVLSSSDDEDDVEEIINPDYPPGYMPIAYQVQIQWDSGDSDGDAEPTSPRPPPPSAAAAPDTGVQAEPTTVTPDEAATDNVIDYNSLAGLMSALAAHGPNQAEETCGLQTAYLQDSDAEAPASGPPRPRRRPLARHTDTNGPAATAPTTANTSTATSTIEPTDLSRQASEGDRLPLAPEQAAAVLRAMQGFTLPASVIPAWASDLPDTAITTLVRDKLGRPSANQNN